MKIDSRFSNLLNEFAKEYGWKTTVQMRKALTMAPPTARYTITTNGNTNTWRASMLLKVLNHETFVVVKDITGKRLLKLLK